MFDILVIGKVNVLELVHKVLRKRKSLEVSVCSLQPDVGKIFKVLFHSMSLDLFLFVRASS